MKIRTYIPCLPYIHKVVVEEDVNMYSSPGWRYFDGNWVSLANENDYLNDEERRSLCTIFNFGDE
jgi:hypothetical protein